MATTVRPTGRSGQRPEAITLGRAVAVVVADLVLLWSLGGILATLTGDRTALPTALVAGLVPALVGAMLVVLVSTIWECWGPVWREPRRHPERWVVAVPLLLVAVVLGRVLAVGIEVASISLLLVALAVALLTGLHNEMLFRGLLLAGLRTRLSEVWVWLGTTVAFAVLPVVVILLVGQGGGPVLFLDGLVVGSALYVVRRWSGGLALPVVLHSLWAWSWLAPAFGTTSPGGGGMGLVVIALPALTVVTAAALVRILRPAVAVSRRS